MLVENSPIVRAVSDEDILVSPLQVAVLAEILSCRDFQIQKTFGHRRDIGHCRRNVRIRKVLQHALADDEVVFLPVSPTRNILLLQAMFLAHRAANFRACILHTGVMSF